ncbi:MAG TPA: histidinol-phosphatase HisJ family protein [Candidatus Limnocylindrales bacterium]|nr:histidinol-phosphatase HisJ family protein [Candidatus Limnocylindrales bacterium]
MSQPTTGPLDLPLDAHLHTDLSPDADVPIDLHAAAARERGVAELAITDHLDFDPRAPAYAFTDYERRLRVVREAAERWDGRPRILFGVEITYRSRDEAAIREHLASHPYDYTIGSVHLGPDSPFRNRDEAGAWCAGKTPREASAWYWDDVEAAIRSELFDTIGHLDFVKRYLVDHLGPFDSAEHADIYERLLRPLADSGAALEVNSSGLRQSPGETYPPPAAVERYRELGGRQVTAGTDAHRLVNFGFGLAEAYRILEAAGFEALARGRTSRPVELPSRTTGGARPR